MTTRRQFLQASAALALPTVVANSLRGAAAPSAKIGLGFIGVGTMGRGHLNYFLGRPQVQVLAVCDVVTERRDDARRMTEARYAKTRKGSYRGCAVYTDFRELLARPDIDAVVIATPDHWHALPCVMAARARKDIYCEKPLTLTVAEGRRIVTEVARAGRIFQVGSQQRTEFAQRFRRAAEYVRNGRIGKVKTIRIGVGAPGRWCDLPEELVPAGTDWDRWLGPAPRRGYNSILCPRGIHKHFPAWRNYLEYGGGLVNDMGAHHFDIAQWGLDMDGSGPVRVEPPEREGVNTGLRFVYANGVEMFHGGRADCVFEGEDGTIEVSRGRIGSTPAAILNTPLGERDVRLGTATDHKVNWLESIKSRRPTMCPAEVGHRTATVCHLANIGYQLRRALRWDLVRERFVGDEAADKMLDRRLRAPWAWA